jgi:plastocyanin
MRKEIIIVLLLIGAIMAVSGCTTTTTTTPNPAPAPAITPTPVPQNQQAYTVNIQNNAFNPSSLQVPAGSTVKWINLDPIQHEPKGNIFDSGPLNQNGVFEHTFNQAGTYNYACAIHPSMQGTITVV